MMRLEDRVVLSDITIAFSATPPPMSYGPPQIRTAYGIDSIRLGSVIGNGAGQTIALIEVGDDPTIVSDLHTFDQTFGLPDPPSFKVLNQDGQPAPLPMPAQPD